MSAARIVRITSTTACLARQAEMANTFGSRLVGLLGRDRLAPGTGMVLQPSNSIHTLFMRFPIDVIFLDDQQRIVATAVHVQPFRIAWGGWNARTAVELPAGTIEQFDLPLGSPIALVPDSTPYTPP
jgi:uncharacterized membrane protein (UPF0127 family)